jgi:hypothetical protein
VEEEDFDDETLVRRMLWRMMLKRLRRWWILRTRGILRSRF